MWSFSWQRRERTKEEKGKKWRKRRFHYNQSGFHIDHFCWYELNENVFLIFSVVSLEPQTGHWRPSQPPVPQYCDSIECDGGGDSLVCCRGVVLCVWLPEYSSDWFLHWWGVCDVITYFPIPPMLPCCYSTYGKTPSDLGGQPVFQTLLYWWWFYGWFTAVVFQNLLWFWLPVSC